MMERSCQRVPPSSAFHIFTLARCWIASGHPRSAIRVTASLLKPNPPKQVFITIFMLPSSFLRAPVPCSNAPTMLPCSRSMLPHAPGAPALFYLCSHVLRGMLPMLPEHLIGSIECSRDAPVLPRCYHAPKLQ